MAHTAHAMSSAHVAHGMHSMRSADAGFKARAMSDTPCSRHLETVASAHVRRALAMHAAALAMNGLSILRMHRCVG